MLLDGLVCLFAVSTLAAHVWSIRYHFDVDIKRMPKGMNKLSLFVLLCVFLMTGLTFYGQQPILPQLMSLVMLASSAMLFMATIRASSKAGLFAAFDEKLPESLLTTGPYSVVRHPFYSSYLLLWSGWAIGTWNPWSLVPLAAIVVTYWVAARDEETKFASTSMAEDYAAYKAKTGRFLPKIFG
ncbi:MAG: isoprenylcysteine carboxylmethyltransferase family protein [Pseudomonadota bacterium]